MSSKSLPKLIYTAILLAALFPLSAGSSTPGGSCGASAKSFTTSALNCVNHVAEPCPPGRVHTCAQSCGISV